MGQDQIRKLLHQGIAAARSGQADAARPVLQQVVRLDPANEIAWMWLSSVAVDDNERIFCLKKLLELNPQHEFAIKGLQTLGVEPRPQTDLPGSTVIPRLDDTKYTRVMQATDEFLLRYNPQPADRLGIRWAHKRRGRYGESGAQRLRQLTLAAALLVIVIVVSAVGYGVSQTDLLSGEGRGVAQVNTRVPTQTPRPTLTPTLGGATPTDFPIPMAVPPTKVPSGLVKGDPFALAVPTEIYPRINTNVARLVQDAVAYYNMGDYATAADMLQQERERSEPHCYPMLVYYEALSIASQGKFQDARELLNWAQNYDPPRGYSTCRGETIILEGLAEVAYLQNPRSGQALELAEQALEDDSRLVAAVLTKARVELAQGQITAARGTIAQGLLSNPDDLNLLILAAEVELADEQGGKALEYLGRVLYVEPAQLDALRLQAQTYLMLAGQSPKGSDRQLQYYGLGVISAQTMLLYYPGDPSGYLYLAQARLGEGNLEMAETALTRILEAEQELPKSFEDVIRHAYQLRGELRYQQGRYEEAEGDLVQVAFTENGSVNAPIVEKLVHIALLNRAFADAESWLEQLEASDPANTAYRLLLARVQVEDCTFFQYKPRCDYDEALGRLSDDFIGGLTDETARASALSYRAQAQYWNTLQQGSASSGGQSRLALQLALNDVTQALAIRSSAVDHYYRGLILEELREPIAAFEEYRWILYWSELYPYPFYSDEFERRAMEVKERAEALMAAQALQQETSGESEQETPATGPEAEPGTSPDGPRVAPIEAVEIP